MASIFMPREGTAKLWITSTALTRRRMEVFTGRRRGASTSSMRRSPGAREASSIRKLSKRRSAPPSVYS